MVIRSVRCETQPRTALEVLAGDGRVLLRTYQDYHHRYSFYLQCLVSPPSLPLIPRNKYNYCLLLNIDVCCLH